MTTTALFNIASCSKAFTAVCIAMLVENNQLDWKDRVTEYIQEFELSDPYVTSAMTMEDILCHRSGLATFDGDLLWYGTEYSPRDVIRRMRHIPLRKEFRSEYGYQNNMYLVAGEIIKEVTGKTWSEYIYDNIFEVLEMKSSRSCSRHLSQEQDIAYPHLKGKVQELPVENPNPALTIFSSVDEMSHWIMMLLNQGKWHGKQILKSSTIEKLFAPHTIQSVSPFMRLHGTHFRAYGLGWSLFDYAGRLVVEHSGGMPGYISRVTLIPEEKFGLVILTNDMNSLPTALRYVILDLLFNRNKQNWLDLFYQFKNQQEERQQNLERIRKEERIPNTKPSLELDRYTGLYEDTMYGKAKIDMRNGKLILTLLPTKEKFTSSMEHWHFDTFRIRFKDQFLPEGFVTFDFNTQREITCFKIDLPNPDFHFHNLDFRKVNRQ
jgi:CubicO group peptidase (beta-lactamase class C family)